MSDGTDPGASGRLTTGVQAYLSAASTSRGDVDLDPAAMAALLGRLAVEPGLESQAEALRPDVGGRACLCLWRDDHVDVWLIAWDGGGDTGWHDHDISSGAFLVLEGTVVEERPRWSGTHEARHVSVGDGLSFGSDHVHRLNADDGRALTVHAYSPPLSRLGQYTVADDGVVRRATISWDEELRAVAP